MNYVVSTKRECRQLTHQLYPRRGVGLLEINSVKVDPQGIKWAENLCRSFNENEFDMLNYVKELIHLDVIIFKFGANLIQYSKSDLLKVLSKFEDSNWALTEADRQELIRYLMVEINNELPA
jgi:hypothetical protein